MKSRTVCSAIEYVAASRRDKMRSTTAIEIERAGIPNPSELRGRENLCQTRQRHLGAKPERSAV
jgi:hypothetical protein